MTLTTSDHPEWEGMATEALLRLGKVWTSFKTGEVREYTRALAGCTAEGIDAAVSALIDAKEPLRDRPKPGQVKSAIPAKFIVHSSGESGLPWWHTDGSFGGDWSSVKQGRLDDILAAIRVYQRNENDAKHAGDIVTKQRAKFAKYLLSLGAKGEAA